MHNNNAIENEKGNGDGDDASCGGGNGGNDWIDKRCEDFGLADSHGRQIWEGRSSPCVGFLSKTLMVNETGDQPLDS